MVIKCPCGKNLKVRSEQKGKKGRCPTCKRMLLVPSSDPVRRDLTDKIPELEKIQLNPNTETQAKRDAEPGALIIQQCKVEERDGDILIQASPSTSAEVSHNKRSDEGDDEPRPAPPVGQATDAHAQSASKHAEQTPEDGLLRTGDLWSRSMIEFGDRLCPNCKERVPNDFKKCPHCAEYFDGVPPQSHCPICGHDVPILRFPRSAGEFSRLLLKGVDCQVCGHIFERKTKFVRWLSLSCLVFTIIWAAWFSVKSYTMLESAF